MAPLSNIKEDIKLHKKGEQKYQQSKGGKVW